MNYAFFHHRDGRRARVRRHPRLRHSAALEVYDTRFSQEPAWRSVHRGPVPPRVARAWLQRHGFRRVRALSLGLGYSPDDLMRDIERYGPGVEQAVRTGRVSPALVNDVVQLALPIYTREIQRRRNLIRGWGVAAGRAASAAAIKPALDAIPEPVRSMAESRLPIPVRGSKKPGTPPPPWLDKVIDPVVDPFGEGFREGVTPGLKVLVTAVVPPVVGTGAALGLLAGFFLFGRKKS